MADKRSNFNKRIEAIHLGAQAMHNLCVESQFDSQTGIFLTDDNSRGAAILSAIANEPMFESVSQETAVSIVSGMQSAVREYENTYGHLPSDELMASAHATMRNMMMLEGAKRDGSTGAMMLESINQSLSTSEGVEIRAKMVGLVLPVLLETATLDAVTMIPAGANEVRSSKFTAALAQTLVTSQRVLKSTKQRLANTHLCVNVTSLSMNSNQTALRQLTSLTLKLT